MNLTKIAFEQKALIYFILAIFLVGGIASYSTMSKLEDPEIKIKSALIITKFPGASATEVDEKITEILEEEIRSMGFIDDVKSRSLANFSEITVNLEETVQDEDVEQYWDILRRKVQNASGKLPPEAMKPTVYDNFGDVYGIFYAMSSDGYNYDEMQAYAENVKREMLAISGVSSVGIFGEQTSCININISEEKLAGVGVHPLEVIMTLNEGNSTVYPGAYETGNHRLRLNVNDQFNSIDDIKKLIIQGHEKDQVSLGDIATIERAYSEPSMTKMKYNQQPSLGLSISMKSGENIVKIGGLVEKRLAELQAEIPAGIEFNKVFFQPEKVSESINLFIINLIESILIVIVVLMLTMGIRSSLIIGSGLILTILGTFPVLFLLDGTLQRVSLGAFILAMGMLVDNAIVVIDGIQIDMQKGIKKKKALLSTPTKTAWPLMGATLIAIFAFLPVFLSPDATGTYTSDLFKVLAISLFISWFLAMTQIPLFAQKWLKVSKKESETNAYNGKLYTFFRKTLHIILRKRLMTMIIIVILIVPAIFSFQYVKQAFFPNFSYNQVYIEFKMPEGTKSSKLESVLEEIETHLLEKSEITSVTTSMGSTPARYTLVRSMAEINSTYGDLIVDFVDYETMMSMKDEIQEYIINTYPEAYSRVRQYNLIVYSSHAVEVQFNGSNPEILKNLSKQVQKIMKNTQGVAQSSVMDNWEAKQLYLEADFNQMNAGYSGLSRSDVSNSLLAATDGIPMMRYFEGDKELPIYLKVRTNKGERISQLENIPVWGVGSINLPLAEALANDIPLDEIKGEILKSTPLSAIVNSIDTKWEEPIIRRINGTRYITAKCDPVKSVGAETIRKRMKKQIENIKLPAGYTMEWKGEFYSQSKAMKYIIMYLPVAVLLIIIVLIMLFKDYKKPAIILLSLPLTIIGIVAALLLTGKEFGFVAIVGVIGLMGMMIKNGVVLIDEIELQIKSGINNYTAIIDSTTSRLRPVIMAALTTILGMIPLIPDPMFGGMAVTIMGGLFVGTVITLFVIPILYSVFFKTDIKKITKI